MLKILMAMGAASAFALAVPVLATTDAPPVDEQRGDLTVPAGGHCGDVMVRAAGHCGDVTTHAGGHCGDVTTHAGGHCGDVTAGGNVLLHNI